MVKPHIDRAFERALLRADADELLSYCPIAASVARGDFAQALAMPLVNDASNFANYPPRSVYVAGVACILSFLQQNWAGPKSPPQSSSNDQDISFHLIRDGEDVAPGIRTPHLLLAARSLLVDASPLLLSAGAQLSPWWAARVLLAHNAVLSAPTPSIQSQLFQLFARFLGPSAARTRFLFADILPSKRKAEESENALAVLAHLELALAQRVFYDPEGALNSIRRACELAQIEISVGGELGTRTKYQQKATAQLIAHAYQAANSGVESSQRHLLTGLALIFPKAEKSETELPLPINVPVNDSDALGYIKLSEIESNSEGNEKLGPEIPDLTPLDQAIVLAHASITQARNAQHILTDQQTAPYVNLVLVNENSRFGTCSLVQMKALVLRASIESDRGRYLERCMTQMESVNKFIDDDMCGFSSEAKNAAALERTVFSFASDIPPYWELKKELAVSLGKIGLVKSAMDIFKELEFWDELVDCHRLLGNVGAAKELISSQLALLDQAVTDASTREEKERAGMKRSVRRPRLLCVLGDVTRDISHFETAWNESGKRYTRAKRSLGRYCVDVGRWSDAIVHLRDALQLNPLYPDIWFSYGCAALELNDMKSAAEAFTQVVVQTPDFGEGWNNLARALTEQGKRKEALGAASQAARVMRESWRVWDNVLTLAIQTRSLTEGLRALERILELRGRDANLGKPLKILAMEVLDETRSKDEASRKEALPLCKRLIRILGKSTAIVSTDAAIWEAYAEVHELLRDDDGIRKGFDCRLRQVRVLRNEGTFRRSLPAFRKMVIASITLCDRCVEVGDISLMKLAEMHGESILEETKDEFGKDIGFRGLQKSTTEVKEKREDVETEMDSMMKSGLLIAAER